MLLEITQTLLAPHVKKLLFNSKTESVIWLFFIAAIHVDILMYSSRNSTFQCLCRDDI